MAGSGAGAAPQDPWSKPASSARIDEGVRRVNGYSSSREAPLADDGEFLRRVMIDLVGYPPTAAETKAFAADSKLSKRADRIDELLAGDDYADLWSRKMSEVLFGNYHHLQLTMRLNLVDKTLARLMQDFCAWMKSNLAKDKPYTDIVYQILDARGSDQGDPALAYKISFYGYTPYSSGYTTVEDYADAVGRHFLGIRLQCARCHDHPFDQWTVENYYALAAFHVRHQVNGVEEQFKDAQGYSFYNHVELRELPEGELNIPREKEDKNAKVNLAHGGSAPPAFPYPAGNIKIQKTDDRQRLLATLMTQKQNLQLPKAFVNRVWGWLFGRGVVHPVDDFNLRNKPLSASLLDSLTRDFVASKYSIKMLLRAILNSTAYQRSSAAEDDYAKIDFSRASIFQLSGEQLLNSIHVATSGKPKRTDWEGIVNLVRPLYAASDVWTEVTPLPGNTRQALFSRNNAEILGWIQGGSVLSAIRTGPGTLEENVDEMFLSALSRKPTDPERQRYAAFLTSHPGPGFVDAYWTLLNSREFVTRH
jgi:hypothetical protein